MKCPKCGYVSFNYLDNCKKCGRDLLKFKEDKNIFELPPGKLALLYFDEEGGSGEASVAVEEGETEPGQESEPENIIPGVGLGDGGAATDLSEDEAPGPEKEKSSPTRARIESTESPEEDDLAKSLEDINFELMKNMDEDEDLLKSIAEDDEPGKIKLQNEGEDVEFEIDDDTPGEEKK